MNNVDPNKVCFIIAHKYFRGYESYLSYYLGNIQKLYPDALTIVVDNNSTYVEDIFGPLRNLKNVVFLINTGSGFELGAYREGLKYVINNNLVNEYSYFILAQDTFILKNYFDFNQLIEKQVYALPINSMWLGGDSYARDIGNKVLTDIGLSTDNWSRANFCWCSSFIVANHKINQLSGYLNNIVQTVRHESEAAERYLGVILWELNDRKETIDIDGGCKDLHLRFYDCWNKNVYAPVSSIFRKHVQQKTQDTRDK